MSKTKLKKKLEEDAIDAVGGLNKSLYSDPKRRRTLIRPKRENKKGVRKWLI